MIAARFNSRPDLTAFLGRKITQGSVSILLGSGISSDLYQDETGESIGLPTWARLVQNLFVSKGDIVGDGSHEAEVDRFRLKYFQDDEEGFATSIRVALYNGIVVDEEVIGRNALLRALGALIICASISKSREVITFNYDDLIERYLLYHGSYVTPIFDEQFWTSASDVLIYHPHGFLSSPSSPFRTRSRKIVLGRKAYSEELLNPGSRWNQKLCSVMRSSFCLFIGLSGDDQRLDVLMRQSLRDHAFNRAELGYWGVTFATNVSQETRRRWAEVGIYQFGLNDYRVDLPRFLFEICETSAEERRRRA